MNTSAKIYVQRGAFVAYYSRALPLKVYIGLDKKLESHPQLILLDGDYQIDSDLSLFTVRDASRCYSEANDTLYAGDLRDNFSHEQNLIIQEEKAALVMDCGHTGIVNIMERAKQYPPALCVGGYHLFNPSTKKTVSAELLGEIAKELKQYPLTQFYTCHCTGTEAFDFLAQQMPNMSYLSCGETVEL